MASGTELWEAWNEGFAKKDSSRLAELLTDDFRFVSVTRDISKQEVLDWTVEGCFQTLMDSLEVLYENDEVAAVLQDADSGKLGKGKVMAVYTKKDGKISQAWHMVGGWRKN
jgi:ketosteroid isomerase-like protein